METFRIKKRTYNGRVVLNVDVSDIVYTGHDKKVDGLYHISLRVVEKNKHLVTEGKDSRKPNAFSSIIGVYNKDDIVVSKDELGLRDLEEHGKNTLPKRLHNEFSSALRDYRKRYMKL